MDKVIFWLIYDLFNYFGLKQIHCFFKSTEIGPQCTVQFIRLYFEWII